MDEGINRIHNASMRILEKTGIRVNHPDLLEIIKSNGVRVCENTVFFTETQIMEYCAKAPAEFTIYARNPKYNLRIGGDNTELGPGYGCPSIIEAGGYKRMAVFEDYCRFLKLVHQCDHFKINGGILVQPSDIQGKHSLPLMLYSTIIHSDKCLMGMPGGIEQEKHIMNMASLVFGGKEALLEKPGLITLINTTSPLQFDRIALDTLMVCAEYDQPVIISPGPMAGATGPVTMAGNIALGNAEALALITIAQMLKEGMPVVYGLQATTTDMKTGSVSIGSPGCALQMVYTARLARAYGLPSRCGGTNTDAKCVSVQSGYESMLAMLGAYQAGANFILHSAGILDGYASMSYEQFIVDLEIISMIKYFLADVEINEDTLVEELIHKVGPGGEFLTSEHTMDNCRKVPFLQEIGLRGVLAEEEDVNKILFNNIGKKLERMQKDYARPALDPYIKAQLDNYLLNNVGVDPYWFYENTSGW